MSTLLSCQLFGREGEEMTGQEKTAQHERAAVAYAHCLVANAGLMWREMTGQDIGIDAILELPYAESEAYSVRGFAVVQVKSRSGSVVDGELKMEYRDRHHLYWLTQRLPVLLCVVEPSDADGFTTGVRGHWIDYKSLKAEDCTITKSGERRWTLRVPITSEHVWSAESMEYSDWSGEAKSFREWIESVFVSSAEAIVRTFCEAADGYLGSGKPDRATACLGQIPLWEEVLLKPDARRAMHMLEAKSIRRLGAVEDQQRLVERAVQSHGPADFLAYELALTYWTKACMTELPAADLPSWEKALEILGAPTTENLRGKLLRLGAYVNVRATLSCVPGKEGEIPDEKHCSDLREVIGEWKDCQEKEIVANPRYHLQLLNALRALCRGYLSRGERAKADLVLQELRDEMATNPDRETLALTDFLLLTAWGAVEDGKQEAAAATLDSTKLLLRSMRDPLLEWFQDVVRGKLEGMQRATNRNV